MSKSHNKRTSKRSKKGGACGCSETLKNTVQPTTAAAPSNPFKIGGSGFSSAATFDSKTNAAAPHYSMNSFENDPSNKPYITASRSNMTGGKRRKKNHSKNKNGSHRSIQKMNAGKKNKSKKNIKRGGNYSLGSLSDIGKGFSDYYLPKMTNGLNSNPNNHPNSSIRG